MAAVEFIPLFPLALVPLPGELIPLHIFEPRYKQLLHDTELNDTPFGIYFNHGINKQKIGSLMKLESIVKRYPGGESDIVVKCLKEFTLVAMHSTFGDKLYPGGDVRFRDNEPGQAPAERLHKAFVQYMAMRNITNPAPQPGLFQIAGELGLNFSDRYKLLTAGPGQRESILLMRLKYLMHLVEQEVKSRDVFHLN